MANYIDPMYIGFMPPHAHTTYDGASTRYAMDPINVLLSYLVRDQTYTVNHQQK